MKREGHQITKLEDKALNAMVAWHREWKREIVNEPSEGSGHTKREIRMFKLAGMVSKVYRDIQKLKITSGI